MFQGLQESQIAGALEALLFVSDEPVGVLNLASMIQLEPVQVEQALKQLQQRFEDDNRGVQLREVAGGWRLYTHPVYHELIEKYVLSWDTRKLSQAALETLAVVAYSQPVTRALVASVRGVNSDSSLNSLVEKGLVREAGSADAPGSPTLYATSRTFLEKFGLRSTADLPPLDQFAPDEETRQLLRERLSATREPVRVSEQIRTDEGDSSDEFAGIAFDFEGDDDAVNGPVGKVLKDEAFGEEETFSASSHDGAEHAQDGRNMLAQAMASSMGVVEKIDFASLKFEDGDE